MDINKMNGMLKLLLFVIGAASAMIGIVRAVILSKKGDGRLRCIKSVAGGAIMLVMCIALVPFLDSLLDQTGEYVKKGRPSSIEGITYGQAIDAVCSNVEWSQVAAEYSENGRDIVQMDADCNYSGEEHRIKMQINYDDDLRIINETSPFEISYIGFDDTEQMSISDMQDIVYDMFLAYASEHGIELDESMKKGILYTDGWKYTDVEDDGSFGEIVDETEASADGLETGVDEWDEAGDKDITEIIRSSESAMQFIEKMGSLYGMEFMESEDKGAYQSQAVGVYDLSDGGRCFDVMIAPDNGDAYEVCGIWCGMDYETALEQLNEICDETSNGFISDESDDFQIGDDLVSIVHDEGNVAGIFYIKDVSYMEN